MSYSDFALLSVAIFWPLVGAVVLVLLKSAAAQTLWRLALGWTVVELGLAIALLTPFLSSNKTSYQRGEKLEWVRALGMNYQVGVDSIAAWLVVLTAFVFLIAIAASGGVVDRPHIFFAWMLTLETSIVGVFASTNLLNFYVFWEVMLIPSYFLIGQWGVTTERVKSAIRFVLYTLAGSLLMLVAMLALAFLTTPAGGVPSLDFMDLRQRIPALSPDVQGWLFLGFAAAFAVKVPLFPFQGWQPDAYCDAPTPVTLILAGVMSKTGAYGFLRFGVFLFPAAAQQYAPLLSTLALISIIYGAVAALGQRDLKRLLSYSSLSHLGFVVLGIFAINEQGVNGAVLQMVNHGITTPALFLALAILTQRTGTTDMNGIRGLQGRLPRMAMLFLVLGLASLGLPGLNQFSGEFLILGGAFAASPIYAIVGVVGVVLAAWYVVRMVQRCFWHQPTQAVSNTPTLPDMRPAEYALFVPLVLLIILLGVAPSLVTSVLEAAVRDWLTPVINIAGK